MRRRDFKIYKLLCILIFFWGLIYGANAVLLNINFWFSAYDVAKHDQTLWLLSEGKTPFNTIRGLHAFGDHAHFILIPLSLFYHLFSSINFFLFLTPFIRGLSVFGIFLIAGNRLNNDRYAALAALSMLLNPAFSNVNLDHFYPETWATTTLVFAFYFSVIRTRWWIYYTLFSITLFMKEDAPLILFMLGLYLFFVERKRLHGAITAGISAVYFIAIVQVILYFAESYTVFKGGGQMGGVLENLFNLDFYWERFSDKDFLKYALQIGGPLLFLFLLRPLPLLIALPSLAANMLSGWIYLKTIDYHYTVYITPFLFISFVYSLEFLQKLLKQQKAGEKAFAGILLAVLAATLTANIFLSKIPLHQIPGETFSKLRHYQTSAAISDIQEAITLIDKSSPVSADTFFTSHLSHRKKIYQFPVPWYQNYYGTSNTPLPSSDNIEYILVKNRHLKGNERHLIDRLIGLRKYQPIFHRGGVLLLKKNPLRSTGNIVPAQESGIVFQENFESESTKGNVRVWSGSLAEKGFTKQMINPEIEGKEKLGDFCYKLSSVSGMDAELFFMIPVQPNTLYHFSGMIHNHDIEKIDSAFYGKYMLQTLSTDGAYDFHKVVDVIKLRDVDRTYPSGWQRQERTFLTSQGVKQIKISASFASWGKAKGALYIDNIMLLRFQK